ncbi:MAG: TlpA family protein disulfide reductase [Myxococcota bacterium]
MSGAVVGTRRGEWLAALIAVVVGLPAVYGFGRAMADAVRRHRSAPYVAVLGADTYERLQAGERTSTHYLGNELLAPDFTLEDRHGRPWTLREHRGKTIVLNFWSITCPPCLREMPTLEELADLARDWPDVEVVAVSTDSGWDEVASALPADPALTVLFDPDKKVVREEFGTTLYPETWIIDPRGVVRFRYDGAFDWSSPLAVELINRYR